MGRSFVQSRNLLAPIALHALWNLLILAQLAAGVRHI